MSYTVYKITGGLLFPILLDLLVVCSEFNMVEAERNASHKISKLIVNTRGYTVDDCTCVCGTSQHEFGAIVGGVEAKRAEFPWIVALMRDGDNFFCAGTLITRYHIMTAAHCLEGLTAKSITIILGEHDRLNPKDTATEIRNLIFAKSYETFDANTYDNDVAILKLDSSVEYTPNIRPACLPRSDDDKDYAGKAAIAIGWGRIEEDKELSNVLRKVELPVLTNKKCIELAGESEVTKNMVCTGYPDGKKDACTGDSGGPLHLNGEVIGIVSWGEGCARPNTPGVFTKVYNYMEWIRKQLGDECLCQPSRRGSGTAEMIFT